MLQKEESIFRQFEHSAALYPEKEALRCGGVALTYRDLNERANQLARHLQALGVQRGECVAICHERSVELIVGLLAILKAGAAFVPINPSYPKARRDFILKECAVRVILDENFEEGVYATSNLAIEAEPDALSHIFYTSGSTGEPKGVQLTHQGVLSLMCNAAWFPITPQDRVLQFSAIAFDLMITEIWGALLNGATLCIYSKKEISLAALASLLVQQRVTHAIFTPKIFNLLVEEQLSSLQSLRYLVSAGEAMSVHHAQIALAALPECRLINGYGPTETNFATAYRIEAIAPSDTSIPIGKPVGNREVYLLDKALQPVSVGILGELYIGGEGVALGYLNRPDLTEKRFIPNPFGPGKLYRSGDLCRMTPEGNLLFVGRQDTQVKLRGFRIELGEIEEVIRFSGQVVDCVVTTAHNMHLVAYLVEKEAFCLQSLQDFVASTLPPYMHPNTYISLNQIPLTANGKVDLHKLPPPTFERTPEGKESFRTNLEREIASIWSEVIPVHALQAEDNFFRLGGTSIDVIHVVLLLNKRLQIDISMTLLFQYPALRDFAHQIATQKTTCQKKITKRSTHSPVPVPWNQESFWQIELMIPHSINYTMFASFKLEGEVHIPSMRKAINKIVSRHEALRTRFEDRGAERVQIIEEPTDVFHFVDLSQLEESETKAQELIQTIVTTPMDLTQGPLLEAHLIQTEKKTFFGVLYVHHIVFDGWSYGLLFKEWRRFYADYLHGRPIVEHDPPIQHADFACWQNRFFASEEAQKQIAYWKKQIQGTTLLQLPWDKPRTERFGKNGSILYCALPEELSERLKERAKEWGATLYELMLAAYNVLLYAYSGQTSILVGSPFANRLNPAVEELLGFFIHMFALRTYLSATQSFSSLLQQVKETMAAAYQNCDIPCEAVFAELYPDWNPTFNRFQVGFSLDTLPPTEEDFEGIKTTWLPQVNAAAKFDFYLGVLVESRVIRFNMYYSADLYLEETVEEMLTQYQNILAALVENPERALKELI